jgi:hypothetical protein
MRLLPPVVTIDLLWDRCAGGCVLQVCLQLQQFILLVRSGRGCISRAALYLSAAVLLLQPARGACFNITDSKAANIRQRAVLTNLLLVRRAAAPNLLLFSSLC